MTPFRRSFTMLLAAAGLPLGGLSAQATRADSSSAYRERIVAATASGDSATLAEAHESLGLAHWRADRFDSALVHLLTTRDIVAARGDSVSLARVLNSLGSTHYQAGNYALALEAYVHALELRARAGNTLGQSYVYTNIGKAYEDWRQYDRALAAFDSAVVFATRADHGLALGYALNARASVLVETGRFIEARDHAERSLAAYYSGRPRIDAVDSASAWSINIMLLGRIDLAEGRLEDAERRFTSIYERALRGNTRRGQAQAQIALAEVHEASRRWTKAASAYRVALAASSAIGNRPQQLEALAGLSRAEERRGNTTEALKIARQHQSLRDSLFDSRTAQRVATLELEAEAARQRAEAAAMAATQRQQARELQKQRTIIALAAALLTITMLLVLTVLRRKERHG